MLVCPAPDIMNSKRKLLSHLDGVPGAKKRRQVDDSEEEQKQGCHQEDVKNVRVLQKRAHVNGMGENGHLRRVASLNAQVALHLLLSESPPASPATSEDFWVGACATKGNESVVEYTHAGIAVEPTRNGQATHVHADLVPDPINHFVDPSEKRSERKLSESSEESPLTSPSTVDDTEERRWPKQPKLKNATVHLVDCKKFATCKQSHKKVPSPTPDSVPIRGTSSQVDSSGYVKRMASLNARACVTALIEFEKRPIKPKPLHYDQSKKSFPSSGTPKSFTPQPEFSEVLTSSTVVVPVPTGKKPILSNKSGVMSESDDLEIPPLYAIFTTHEEKLAEDELAAPTFNTMGLLYNGDTMYPYSPVFLTSERTLPSPILPIIVPAKTDTLRQLIRNAKEPSKRRKLRATKGNNGWTCIGEPIKTIRYYEGDENITRRYYIGIRRRNEEVFVRDCVLVKAGRKKQEKPYAAKIASLWQETGRITMTVFWYYRPEEAVGTNIADFQENEVLASQHYDDNSVACLEDKCYILGFRQYCRYHALAKRAEDNVDTVSVVPTEDAASELPENVKSELVLLCYRGYNHIAGKVCKGNK